MSSSQTTNRVQPVKGKGEIEGWKERCKMENVQEIMETVDLISSGYEWTCPDDECQSFNREIEATDVVVCPECGRSYGVGEVHHAIG